MTRQYEQESSPLTHQALIGNLLETTLSEGETSTSTAVNNYANFCLQGELLEPEELTTERFSRLLLSRMKGDELVDYCLFFEKINFNSLHKDQFMKLTNSHNFKN